MISSRKKRSTNKGSRRFIHLFKKNKNFITLLIIIIIFLLLLFSALWELIFKESLIRSYELNYIKNLY